MRRSVAACQLLAYEKIVTSSASAHPRHSIGFMHGILGNKRNWQTPAKLFQQAMPDFAAVTIDHRGHGSSTATVDSSPTLAGCAEELDALFSDSGFLNDIGQQEHHHKQQKHSKHVRPHADQASVPTVLCGHSFGGKVALAYLKHAMAMGRPLPAVTFILDALPGLYSVENDQKSHQQSVFALMEVLRAAPPTYPTKKDALDYLAVRGVEPGIVHWLAANLVPEGDGVRFCFDIGHALRLFEDYCHSDYWDFLFDFNRASHIEQQQLAHLSHPKPAPQIVFVRAGRNKAWTASVLDRFNELHSGAHSAHPHPHAGHRHPDANAHGNVTLLTMPDVGHWLHVDNTQGLVKILVDHSQAVLSRYHHE